MKITLMISTLVFGMVILYGCASSVEEKPPVEASKFVPVSGIEKVEDKVSALEYNGLSPDEIEKLNRVKEAIAENMPLIESQLQGILNMPIEVKTGDEMVISKEDLKDALWGIEKEVEGYTREEDKNVPAVP